MWHRFFLTALVCFLFVGLGYSSAVQAQNSEAACAGGYSSEFTITGEVNHPATYNKMSLNALAHSIENVTFLTMTGPQSSSFKGVLLWNLLTTAGIKTDPTRNGQFQYVEITGTDCYQVVLALGELDPNLGGEQVLVADRQNGSRLGAATGFARIIVRGDKFGARDTFWINKIEVLSGPPPS
jgi:DMSO/TMAO reductase YedYZ molybdopterin-dependent catalytic subunit